MANNFLTVTDIADQALLRLRANEVMSALVWRDFDEEFTARKGDTVNVKVPNTFAANDFSTSISAQNINEGSVPVKLDSIADVSVNITSKERALNLNDFTEQVINPAMEALASKIDRSLVELYKDVPAFTGVAGTTPSTLAAFADSGKVLNVNKVPMQQRRGVWDPAALAEFQQLDSFVEVDKSASTETLRDGSIGRVYMIDNFMDQNIATHVAGGYTALTDVTITAGAADASTISLTSAAGTSTAALVKGDVFTLDGVQYTVTADTAAAASGVIASVTIYPALPVAFGDMGSAAVSFADVTAGGHVSNLVFHRNAFVFVNRPMDLPMGGAEGAIANFEGLSVRVTQGYNMENKTETLSFDILYGMKTVHPELAVRVLG